MKTVACNNTTLIHSKLLCSHTKPNKTNHTFSPQSNYHSVGTPKSNCVCILKHPESLQKASNPKKPLLAMFLMTFVSVPFALSMDTP